MTAWSALDVFTQVLIVYYFGNAVNFYAGVTLFFVIGLAISGIELRMAILFALPLIGAFALYGAFGAHTWVSAVVLVIVAIIYGYAVIDLFT